MKAMKELREQKGLSQMDIAVETGLAPATISRLEAGLYKPLRTTKILIAKALGVEPEEIEWPEVKKQKTD